MAAARTGRPRAGLAATTAAVVLLSGGAAGAQGPAGWPAFEQAFRAYVAADGVVGASAVVVERGQIVARAMVGHQDRERGVPVDSSTLFHWGRSPRRSRPSR